MRATALLVGLMLVPAGASAQANWPAMVVLVRHAERAPEPKDDPGLSDAGRARALALAAALEHAGVTAIITTELRRTRDTAAPIAQGQALTPETVRTIPGGVVAHAEDVAAAVRRHAGGVVLVVGHSNTIPAIIAALGGPRLPDICDASFANLYVLTFPTRTANLVRSHYGVGDPPGGPGCQ